MSIEPLNALKGGEESLVSVTKAIRQAARQSGLDFDLMLGVAQRESSLRPDARAATSSASGLFQFIDQTWLGAIKEHGAAIGLGEHASAITRTGDGFTVADPARREEILNLRFQPAIAAKVAGRTLAAAKDRLTAALGREASGSEVYMAHFLGERGAVRMLSAGDEAVAAAVDPRAARANAPLFYDGDRPLSVGEFKQKIALHLGQDEAVPPAERPVYRGPYRPGAEPRAESRARPSATGVAQAAGSLPPQLYAAIVEMQSAFILGGRDD